MQRRDFLRDSVIGATLAAVPSAVGGADVGEPKRPIAIGFFGATYSHARDKIKLALSSPDWEFVGVCDESAPGRRVCEALGAPVISRDELLRRAEVVAIGSDVAEHAPHALAALKAGKHVHLEKPPATRVEEIREIVALAKEKRLLVQTGYMWRYHPGFAAILEAVRRGWLGEVFLVRGHIANNLSPKQRAEWGAFRGGSMYELGSHLIDAVVRLLGRPKTVVPILRSHGKTDDGLKDNNVVVLEYPRATAVVMNNSIQAGAAPARSFEVLGSNGYALLQPIEPPKLLIDLVSAAGPYQRGPQQPPLPPYRRYEADFVELAAAVRGERPLSVGLDEELLSAETLLRASEMI